MSRVVLMKLISGEEIIAKVIDESITNYTLESVRSLMMQPTGPGQVGLALMPWLATAPDDKVPLEKVHVMYNNPIVPDELEKNYLEQTSGIQIASAGQFK